MEILQAEREAEPLAAGGTASEEKVKNLQVRDAVASFLSGSAS